MGLFDFFKTKEITLEECLIFLLKIQSLVEDKVLKEFSDFQQDEGHLIYEVRIFSLWVVTLSVQSQSIRDGMHTAFCKKFELSENGKQSFYKDLQCRYGNYFSAFSMVQEGSSSGQMILGGTIFDVIVNKNKTLSLSTGAMPVVGIEEAFLAMNVFQDAYLLCLRKIKNQGLVEVIKKY